MTTATSTDVQLDQRTRDEMQPPCEMRMFLVLFETILESTERRCEAAAANIVRTTCNCGPGTYLTCIDHTAEAQAKGMWCRCCSSPKTVQSIEAI